ncbi:MAG: glycosyltransferase family 4 protein [Geminicoccaceae bacterium]
MAVVHDWLTVYGGAERVLEQILGIIPHAELFSLIDFVPAEQRGFLGGRVVHTSFLQKLPFARQQYRRFLPLMPLAIEQFDLSGFDLVVSSSYAVAKGVITGPDQLHVAYVHSPVRFAWDLQHQYLTQSGITHGPMAWIARAMLHRLRLWDSRTANGVDHFIANSSFIERRIWKVYRRPAQVIYPPVDLGRFRLVADKGDRYVTVSRLVPYKRVDLIIQAFARTPHRRLTVIGDGPDFDKLRQMAPPNVELTGFLPADRMRLHVERARGFIFAAEEDFGIVMVEAQACGTPVIAYGKGGAPEVVHDLDDPYPTGVLFDEQTVDSLATALDRFEAEGYRISPTNCRRNAERFGHARFCSEFAEAVAEQLQQRSPSRGTASLYRSGIAAPGYAGVPTAVS